MPQNTHSGEQEMQFFDRQPRSYSAGLENLYSLRAAISYAQPSGSLRPCASSEWCERQKAGRAIDVVLTCVQ